MKLNEILLDGEGATVEFKRCGNSVERDVFETLCAFANRFGGDLYLGVDDDGSVIGIDGARCQELMRNIVNVANNPNVFSPQLYVTVDNIVYDGKNVIHVHVPISGEVHSFKGDIFDRLGESDVKVRASSQIADMYIRKRDVSSEREVFPDLSIEDFRLEMLPMLRQEAQNHLTDGRQHPWTTMSDAELFQSSGLVGKDPVSGRRGFNLAAVLLLGKDDTIRSVCPQYETDALLKVVNVERYDDRRIVRTNLLDSYYELLECSRKHLPAPFFLVNEERVNLREIIVREMVSNILIHREFMSSAKSEFVIERERMYTSNPCRPFRDGIISLDDVEPRAKNPIIASFFREIGRADKLGSGIRNLYMYCKHYGGEDPVFTEGNIFTISISLKKLEAIRFPFQKPSIGGEKPSIGGEKPSIDELLARLRLTQPTRENIKKLASALKDGEIFGRSRIMEIVGLSNGPAGDMINTMLRNGLLDSVRGHGKGKYRFRI